MSLPFLNTAQQPKTDIWNAICYVLKNEICKQILMHAPITFLPEIKPQKTPTKHHGSEMENGCQRQWFLAPSLRQHPKPVRINQYSIFFINSSLTSFSTQHTRTTPKNKKTKIPKHKNNNINKTLVTPEKKPNIPKSTNVGKNTLLTPKNTKNPESTTFHTPTKTNNHNNPIFANVGENSLTNFITPQRTYNTPELSNKHKQPLPSRWVRPFYQQPKTPYLTYIHNHRRQDTPNKKSKTNHYTPPRESPTRWVITHFTWF